MHARAHEHFFTNRCLLDLNIITLVLLIIFYICLIDTSSLTGQVYISSLILTDKLDIYIVQLSHIQIDDFFYFGEFFSIFHSCVSSLPHRGAT